MKRGVIRGDKTMTYVKCTSCNIGIHFNPIDFEEFRKRFVDGNEPIYCFECFKERIENPKKT